MKFCLHENFEDIITEKLIMEYYGILVKCQEIR